jgi:sortase A
LCPVMSSPPSRQTTFLRLERLLWIVAVLSLGFCAWAWVDSNYYQFSLGQRLDRILESRSAAPGSLLKNGIATRTRSEALKRGLVGRVEIPRLKVVAMVAEGVTPRKLRKAVGHVPGTAFPGESGNVAIAGHRDSFFRGLKDVRRGDRIRLNTPDGNFEYRVDSIRLVKPSQTQVLAASKMPTLTLITCYPFYYVGAAPDRFIVRARQVAEGPRSR